MWEKIVDYLLAQGFAGVAIICLGAVLWLVYKEAKRERDSYKEERKESTDKILQLATESVKYIQENTGILRDMKEEMRQHNDQAQESRVQTAATMEKMVTLLDVELRNRGRGDK